MYVLDMLFFQPSMTSSELFSVGNVRENQSLLLSTSFHSLSISLFCFFFLPPPSPPACFSLNIHQQLSLTVLGLPDFSLHHRHFGFHDSYTQNIPWLFSVFLDYFFFITQKLTSALVDFFDFSRHQLTDFLYSSIHQENSLALLLWLIFLTFLCTNKMLKTSQFSCLLYSARARLRSD